MVMEINASIIVQLAVILTLMLWLSKVLFRPIMQLFDEREARIQGAKAEAKALEVQGNDKENLIDERMRRAQKEARDIFLNLQAEGAAFQRQVTDKAKADAREKIASAKVRIQGELEQARAQMTPFVQENAGLLVARLKSSESQSPQKANSQKMEFRSA